jgi:hypothetical protein
MILPIVLMLAQAPSTTSAYPLTTVLEEARNTCALVAEPAADEATLAGRGWQQSTREPSGWLNNYVRQNAKLNEIVGEPVYHELLQKTVAGRDLTLYIFSIGVPTNPERKWGSCEVLDLNADGGINAESVIRWAGREPEPSLPLGSVIVLRWVPALSPGAMDTAITYSPPGSALASIRPGLIYTVVARTGNPKQ